MPMHEGVGPDDCKNLQNGRKPIQLNKEPAVVVHELRPTAHLAPHDQMMSKYMCGLKEVSSGSTTAVPPWLSLEVTKVDAR